MSVTRVAFDKLVEAMAAALVGVGTDPPRARRCAEIIAGNDRDGVYSHGLRRFPGLMAYIRQGHVDVRAEPAVVGGFGAIEQWDGRKGLGPLNAEKFMGRAIELAREHGLGCVAARNTSHWMRGGTYGLQAASAGCIGICWTNAIPIMAAYGAEDRKLGNNPLVIAVPRSNGPLLLDMAMTQFSSGRLGLYKERGETLPVPGGFDAEGNLSTDPEAIRASGRPLPIGYWKGAGLSLLLDTVATLLSGGRATHQIAKDSDEVAVSQVFIAMDLSRLASAAERDAAADAIIADYLGARPVSADRPVHYPGARMLAERERNDRDGIPVDDATWQRTLSFKRP